MSDDTLLVVGAGFSKPFGGPLLRELFDSPFTANSAADSDALMALAALANERDPEGTPVGMEEAFTRLWEEQYTATPFSINGRDWAAGELVRELRLHLTSVASDVRLDFRSPLAHQLQSFLKGLTKESRSLTILSFNYDTLVEDCLEHAGLVYSYGDRRSLTFVDKSKERALDKYLVDMEVLKLHGSVNWGVCRDCTEAPVDADLVNAFNGVFGLGRNVSCQFCDKKFLQSSIVPPVETKGAGLHSMKIFWQRAHRAATRAREVLIVGYSLPPADTRAAALMGVVAGASKRPRIRIVCGSGRVPYSYERLLKRFDNLGCRFEEFLRSEYG